ncbi:MAG TPA: D-alanine--D-alanine ligase [Planctomycetota bacterium]|nr:D-alanine--D-alanine ligase [Planctomycetota bacterium]
MSPRRKAHRRLRVLLLNHPALAAPDSAEGATAEEQAVWKTEYDVATTLRRLGHEVLKLHVQDELQPIRAAIEEWKPQVVFNLLEEFAGLAVFDQHVVSYLELLGVPYTGCNPRGLMLARGKGLAKKLVGYHRIRTPGFLVLPRGSKPRRPKALGFPLIVKSLTEEASLGIAQASVVDDDGKLAERVAFVHEKLGTDALAESYIAGRELYVSVLGNERLTVLPVWELVFEKLPEGHAAIATARVKHDPKYQKKVGIADRPAEDLSPEQRQAIARVSRRIYRILELDGYARLDFRLAADGALFFLEANPNPEIARDEEFARAAEAAGLKYPELIQRLLSLALRRPARG